MNEDKKFDWSDYGSIRVPTSVVKQLDEYKQKHGYTSRPQAIISAIEKAEKSNIVDDIKQILYEFLENEGENIVRKHIVSIAKSR